MSSEPGERAPAARFHFQHESTVLRPPQRGLRGREHGLACWFEKLFGFKSFLVLKASSHRSSSPPALTQSQTISVALPPPRSLLFSALRAFLPFSLPLLSTKTPLELSPSPKVLKPVENEATLSSCSCEPRNDWKPPPGRTGTGLT